MIVGAALLLVLVVVVVVLTTRAAVGRNATDVGAAPAAPAPHRSPVAHLEDDVQRWRDAGVIDEATAAAVLAFERTRLQTAPPPTSAQPAPTTPALVLPRALEPGRRVPAAAEALGYFGGLLAIIGIVLLVTRYWPDLGLGGRLGISAGGAVVLHGAGLAAPEAADPAFARMRWFLWLVASAAAAVAGGVVVHDGVGSDAGATITLVGATAVAVHGVVARWWQERPVQQLTFFAAIATGVGAFVHGVADRAVVGSAVWVVGAAFLALGLTRRVPLAAVTEVVGSIAVVVGAVVLADDLRAYGPPFTILTAVALLALSVAPMFDLEIGDRVATLPPAVVALTFGVPTTLGYYAERGGIATGAVTWSIGVGLIVLAASGRVRAAPLVEAAGAAATVGGAALTGAQVTGFGPIVGLLTAVALVAAGTRPGRVLLSLFGSIGLLVNVPWAIGHFFPGEGRAPLLIAVSGALIVAVAALLARMSDRFRTELGQNRPARV